MSNSWDSKVDRNQREIVEALRAVGCSVALTHRVGGGFPDILVGYRDKGGERINILMEIKAEGGRLNEREARWHKEWRGQVVVVRDIAEALEAIELGISDDKWGNEEGREEARDG